MRAGHLFRRTRPFRYAGFWAVSAGLLSAGPGAGRSALQVGAGAAFCVLWPWLADVWQRRAPATVRVERAGYALECTLVGLVFALVGAPPLLLFATLLCLLAGAIALAGPWLLLASAMALLPGLAVGVLLAPPGWLQATPADGLALIIVSGFTVTLGHLAFRQALRLDGQRRRLASRSLELERQNGRMQRYLPLSLRQRLQSGPDAPVAWERRWLTVVFVDLAGFTALAERLDPEVLAQVLDDYLGTLIPAVERRGGEVSKLLGDGLLAAFGTLGRPGGVSGRRVLAEQALALAREAPALIANLAPHWRARGEPLRLQLRCGIASGYCTLGDRGGPERMDFTLIGSPVNLASRLQSLADLDGVLMDAATAALAGADDAAGDARRVSPRGFGDRVVYASAPVAHATGSTAPAS